MKKNNDAPRLILGENVKPCPNCKKPLSFANDHFFCRSCPLGHSILISVKPSFENVKLIHPAEPGAA
jgi:hypothetical protein